jgi:RNA polymerase sigma factor (sigma-70 family)
MSDLIRTVLGQGRPGRDATSTDAELLRAYTRTGDHAAFVQLVERHGPMVYAVCRRILNDPNDADDAFQAVFLVFIRRAESLRGGKLAGWFYGVALRTAKEARKVSARRQRLDEKYRTTRPPETAEPVDPVESDDLRAVLDRELARLTESARAAIILCDMEGRTRKEAAAELGCPEGTLATRLARARELLASRLARLGIALGVTALVAYFASEAKAAVPVKLKQTVFEFPSAATAAPAVLALAGRAVVTTGWLRLGVMGTSVVALVAAVVTGVLWVTQPGGPGPAGGGPPTGGPPEALGPRGHAKLRPDPPIPGLVVADAEKTRVIRDGDKAVVEQGAGVPKDGVVSPDGTRFVTIGVAEGKIHGQIFVGEIGMKPRAGVWIQPPMFPGNPDPPKSLDPSWHPDGKRVVFLLDPTSGCMPPGLQGLVMTLDPSTKKFGITSIASPGLLSLPKYHPDGRRISVLHQVGRENDQRVFDLVLHEGKKSEVVLANVPVLDYVFSPDGTRVAVSLVGRGVVFVELATRKEVWLRLPVKGISPELDLAELTWRPDGKMIAFRPHSVRENTGPDQEPRNLAPPEVRSVDLVGFIQVTETPALETFIQLDPRFRITHWQAVDQPVKW